MAVVKGKEPDGVSYSSCSPQHELKDAQKHHKPVAMEKKKAVEAATLLLVGFTTSLTPCGPSPLLLSEGMWQLELKAAQLCLPTGSWQDEGKR